MRPMGICTIVLGLIAGSLTTEAQAQRMQQREREFLRSKPLIGERLPDVTVFAIDGTPFKTADLRGHYTVLTFGCLT